MDLKDKEVVSSVPNSWTILEFKKDTNKWQSGAQKIKRREAFFLLTLSSSPFLLLFHDSYIAENAKTEGKEAKGKAERVVRRRSGRRKRKVISLCWTFTVKLSFMDHLELFCVYLWSDGVSRTGYCKVRTKDHLWYLFQVRSSGRLSQPTPSKSLWDPGLCIVTSFPSGSNAP